MEFGCALVGGDCGQGIVLGSRGIVLGSLIGIIVGQGPTVLAEVQEGVVRNFFVSSVISLFSLLVSERRPDSD